LVFLFVFYSESIHVDRGTQIFEHEETVQLTPTTTKTTTIYESHRTLGSTQPIHPTTSTGFRTVSPVRTEQIDEPQVEEKYEVTLSSLTELKPLIKATDDG